MHSTGKTVEGLRTVDGICNLCECPFKNPRVLPGCGHTFCMDCLTSFENFNATGITCSVCWSVVPFRKRPTLEEMQRGCKINGPYYESAKDLPTPFSKIPVPYPPLPVILDPLRLYPPPVLRGRGPVSSGAQWWESDTTDTNSFCSHIPLQKTPVLFLPPCSRPTPPANIIFNWLKTLWMTPSDLTQKVSIEEQSAVLVPYWVFSCNAFVKFSYMIGSSENMTPQHSSLSVVCYNIYSCAHALPDIRAHFDKHFRNWNFSLEHVAHPLHNCVLEWVLGTKSYENPATNTHASAHTTTRWKVIPSDHQQSSPSTFPSSDKAEGDALLICSLGTTDPKNYYFTRGDPPMQLAEVGVTCDEAWQQKCQPFTKAVLIDQCKRLIDDSSKEFDWVTSFDDVRAVLVYFPVYICTYKYNNTLYQVSINAQTNEITGKRPYGAGFVGGLGKFTKNLRLGGTPSKH
ncbi:hypothetical protein Pelo_10922 [Pelomyxa schiedti]|nr:hypothetical protein Pelo_10922 [Pelomyxa schiedti]